MWQVCQRFAKYLSGVDAPVLELSLRNCWSLQRLTFVSKQTVLQALYVVGKLCSGVVVQRPR